MNNGTDIPDAVSMGAHPEAASLRARCAALREELAKLICERDHYEATVLPEIEAEYALKIGRFEYEAFQLECETRRLRRNIELVRMRINRNEKVAPAEIERQLDAEFAEWEEQARVMVDAIAAAREWLDAPRLTREESRELQKLYRQLAKRLHPDVAPTPQSERDRNLWLQASAAYRDGDLEELRTLALLLGDEREDELSVQGDGAAPSILDAWRNKAQELEQRVHDLLEQLAKIKTTLPYLWGDLLEDEEWVEAQVEMARRRIAELETYKSELNAALKDALSTALFDDADTDEWSEFIEVCDE